MKNSIEGSERQEYCLILSTAPDLEEGRRLAKVLVEERLAACANLIPVAASVYRWEGKVEENPEILLLLKTERAKAGELLARLKTIHPYTCPEGIIVPLVGGLEGYLNWIGESVRASI